MGLGPGTVSPSHTQWFLRIANFSRCCGSEPMFQAWIVPPTTQAPRRFEPQSRDGGRVMLGWVVTFLVIALIAGILGFGGIAGASIEIAKIIFFIAIVLFLVSAVVGVARGRTRI